MRIRVVIPAFSRSGSLERALDSVLKAFKLSADFDVLVSIDGGGDEKVLSVAMNFVEKFNSEQYHVHVHETNKGLKNHILWCGDLVSEYDAVIILEDDLVVDQYFFIYALSVLKFFGDIQEIAGFSLYSPDYNEFESLPFAPTRLNGSANYFMQIPCSWGQMWTKSQWMNFSAWYAKQRDVNLLEYHDMPEPVKYWPKSSWKKLFFAYMLDTNTYFVYPFRSYSTNCSDKGGTHNESGINFLQVPIHHNPLTVGDLDFVMFSDHAVIYDSRFERKNIVLAELDGCVSSGVTMDFYGSKRDYSEFEYVLTTKRVRHSIATYPVKFHPLDENLKYPGESSPISLNLAKSRDVIEANKIDKLRIRYGIANYYSKFDLADTFIILSVLKDKFMRLIGKILLKL